jgi:ABC-2 type transport system ATP-binding protein
MTECAIKTKYLSKTFREKGENEVRAVDDISFEVRQGEIFGLLGPNGAGKSTTIKVLTTLLPPSSGSAIILGHDVVQQPLEVRRNIVAVLQENAVEIFLSVKDNFRTFGRFQGLDTKEIEKQSERVMELFGLTEYRNQKPIDLSGGLKRRVQVAKVFMVNKPIVFLDEVTTGMDTINKRTTLNAIKEEARLGRTIVLTTHVLEEAEDLCDSLVIINHGNIIASGTPSQVKSLSALRLYYLTLTFEQWSDRFVELINNHQPFAVEVNPPSINVTVRDEAVAVRILASLQQAGITPHFEMTGATLEDAFLHLIDTGKERT